MRLIRRILSMCAPSWELLMRALQLSCLLLFCAFMLLTDAGPMTGSNYDTYLLAEELFTLPQALLMAAAFAGVMLEDRLSR